MTEPLPPAAIGAHAPTSRSTFRLLARCVEATNREADTLRHALLDQWADFSDPHELGERLRAVDRDDPDGLRGVEPRLAVWFAPVDPGDGSLVLEDDRVLTNVSETLRARLAGITRSGQD